MEKDTPVENMMFIQSQQATTQLSKRHQHVISSWKKIWDLYKFAA
jgi:hypothetical protein